MNQFTPLGYSFDVWKTLPDKERETILEKFYQSNKSYIEEALGQEDWIMILGSSGKVYASGVRETYPRNEEMRSVALETNEFPVVYVKAPKFSRRV